MDSYREITETLGRTLGRIGELLDSAGNPQHLMGALDAAVSRVAEDMSATLAVEAKQRELDEKQKEFEKKQKEVEEWAEQLAIREEKINVSESKLSKNIGDLTGATRRVATPTSNADQTVQHLNEFASGNQAVISQLQARLETDGPQVETLSTTSSGLTVAASSIEQSAEKLKDLWTSSDTSPQLESLSGIMADLNTATSIEDTREQQRGNQI
ncbi:MAG: hypothetical protein Q9224_007635 [Gallowayella concinna]